MTAKTVGSFHGFKKQEFTSVITDMISFLFGLPHFIYRKTFSQGLDEIWGSCPDDTTFISTIFLSINRTTSLCVRPVAEIQFPNTHATHTQEPKGLTPAAAPAAPVARMPRH